MLSMHSAVIFVNTRNDDGDGGARMEICMALRFKVWTDERTAYSSCSCDGNGHGKCGGRQIKSSVGRGRRGRILQLCEVALALRKVRQFCAWNDASAQCNGETAAGSLLSSLSSKRGGLVRSALQSALSSELDLLYAQMAAVEAQAKNDAEWSLRRLSLW